MALRCLPGDLGPGPAFFTGLQLALDPAQLIRRDARLIACNALDGQDGQFTMDTAAGKVGRQFDQPRHGPVNQGLRHLGIRGLAGRQIVHAVARRRHLVRFKLATDACPDFISQHALLEDQGFEHRITRLGRLKQGQPERQRIIEHAGIPARTAALQRITDKILFGLAKQRKIEVKFAPLLFPGELFQPLTAQSLGNVGLFVARKKASNRCRVRILEIKQQAPVVDIDFELMPFQLGRNALHPHPVTQTKGITRSKEAFVRGRRNRQRMNQENGEEKSRVAKLHDKLEHL